MVKKKILKKQTISLKNIPKLKLKKNVHLEKYDPMEVLLDEDFIKKAMIECLENNDLAGAVEVMSYHLSALQEGKNIKKLKTSKYTLFQDLKTKHSAAEAFAKMVDAFHYARK